MSNLILLKEFRFSLDPCANKENAKCEKYYNEFEEESGLIQNWENEIVFVNPPFSNIATWVEKCYNEGQKENTIVVMILPSRTDTAYWHNFCMKAYEIRFCKGRVILSKKKKNIYIK